MPPQDPMHNNGEGNRLGGSQHPSSNRVLGDSCDDDEPDSLRPPGERERVESMRVPRESQRAVLRNRRRSFVVQFSEMDGPPQIALLMALLAIGLGCTIGVVPAIAGDRFARLHHGYDGVADCSSFDSETKPEACFLGGSDAQAAASLANLINNSLTFLTASLAGSISDEYGRKGPMIAGLTLSMGSALCLYLLQVYPTMSPWWYYGTSASSGLVSWMAVALSALNDVLPQEFRAPGIGLLFAGFLFGLSLSPTLALVLDRKTLSLVSFGVVIVGFLLTIFMVPETLPAHVGEAAKKRRREKEAHQDERDRQKAEDEEYSERKLVAGLRKLYYGSCLIKTARRVVWRPFQEMSILNRNCFFRLLSALAFFTGMVTAGDQVLLIYYLEDQLNFDAKDVSLMFLIIGGTGIFVQVVVMKPLNDWVGEQMVVALSFCGGTLANLVYGIARQKSTIFWGLLVAGFSNMSFPTISAMKANNVESTEQGRIQGALYSVKALASGLGPALLQLVYSKTKNFDGAVLGPGTMFVFASGLYVVGVGLALALPKDMANSSPLHGGRPTAETTTTNGLGLSAIDDEALGEYRRLAAESSESSSLSCEDEEDYGSI